MILKGAQCVKAAAVEVLLLVDEPHGKGSVVMAAVWHIAYLILLS
jgi:hypothetical protein